MWRIVFVLMVFILTYSYLVKADEIENIAQEIRKLAQDLENIKLQTKLNAQELKNKENQINSIRNQVDNIEKAILKKEKEVKQGEVNLENQKRILRMRVASHYKNLGAETSNLINLIIGNNITESLQEFFYQKRLLQRDQENIDTIVTEITQLKEKKASLISEKSEFVAIKKALDEDAILLARAIESARQKEQEVENKITALSIKQQELIAKKLASLNLPVSVGNSGILGCTDDRKTDPGFSPAYAFFTFGIPHRVGMSQFGAYGRARAGQNYEQILNAYYNNIRLECKSFPNQKLKVSGYGEVDIYDYLHGLGEMPERWGNEGAYEALKAQIVAAASYAYAYTNGGENEICTTQACQVYTGRRKGGKWEEAVNEIRGKCGDGVQVAVSNDTGEVIKAWYASTFGGVALQSGEVWGGVNKPWTKHFVDASGNPSSIGELSQLAYDRESECFYSAHGYRPEANKTAWLRSEELADIVNVLMLAKRDPGVQVHLSQLDRANPDGSDTWDREKVKYELRNRGGLPFSRIDSVSTSIDINGGQTTTVVVSGDAGTQSFSGGEFKNYFNLRAPANIQIVGPMFNVEKR